MKPKFNGVYSRNNLSIIKDEAFVTNLDEYESIGSHWISFSLRARGRFIQPIFDKRFDHFSL